MISIVIPSMGREQRLNYILYQLEEEIPADAEIIVVLDEKDIKDKLDIFKVMIRLHEKTRFIVSSVKGCWGCTNVGLDQAKYDFIMWTADDIKPHSGWFEIAHKKFLKDCPSGLGLLIMNDLHMGDQVAGHVMTTKRFLQVLFNEPRLPGGFYHFFCDTMIADWAKMLGRKGYARSSMAKGRWAWESKGKIKTHEISKPTPST